MSKSCIAIDLGGSRVRVARVHSDAQISWREAVPTANTGNPADVLEQIASIIDSRDKTALSGIAIACPGPLNTATGVVTRIPTLQGWEDIRLRDIFEARFGLPVFIENDAVAAAAGQWRFGAGRGYDNLVYLTISTGIGGGIISNGQVLRGARGLAGHFGHMLLYPDSSRQCACGRYGCFEAYASGTALNALARKMSTAGSAECQSIWATALNNEPASAIHLARAAESGHKPSLIAWEEEGKYLACGISSIIHALDPDVVVLGGGVSRSYRWFEQTLRKQLQLRLMPELSRVAIKQAEHLRDAGLIGVAALLFDTLA